MQFVRIFVFFHWSPAFRINSCTRRCTSSSVWSVANLNIMNKSLNKIVQTLFQNLLWKIRMIWKKGNRNLVWNFRQIVWRAGHLAVRALHVFKKAVGQDGSMPDWLILHCWLTGRNYEFFVRHDGDMSPDFVRKLLKALGTSSDPVQYIVNMLHEFRDTGSKDDLSYFQLVTTGSMEHPDIVNYLVLQT